MLGAIAGDIIGSVYEAHPIKTTEFRLFRWDCTFTDDTVMTVAVADAILTGAPYADKFREYFRLFPNAGYGFKFRAWAQSNRSEPYGSWGNGSAMRVSPIGHAFDILEQVLEEAERSAEVTHNHPDAVAGAQATAAAVYLARMGRSKAEIRAYLEETFRYQLDGPLDQIRSWYRFDLSCRGTSHPLWWRFWSRTATKTPSARPSPWAATATPWPASPAVSPRPSTASPSARRARRSATCDRPSTKS